MIYGKDVTTPKNTPLTIPLVSKLTVTKGLIYRIEIEFPPGPAGLLYVAIFDGSFQVWPSTPGTWFHTDGKVIGFDDLYLKEAQPYEFTIHTYNLDDTYDHWCQIRLGCVSKEAYMARFLPGLQWEKYNELLARLEVQQQKSYQEVIEQPFSWIPPQGGE